LEENLFEIIKDFSREKGLDHEVVIKLVEESLIQAAQRKLPYREIEGHIDEDTGKINLFHFKEVVELVEDPHNEISVDEVFEIDPDAGLGDEVEYEISDREFQRIAHSTRPIIFGSLKEAERQMVVSIFTDKVGDVLTGTVLRVEPNGRVAFSFQNNVEAYLFRREQIYGENFSFGDHVRVLLLDVNDNPHKDSQLTISRTHPGLLIKLFEMEVPEIFDGIVKIVNASREPGRRAKISVYSTDDDVDPVGSCVGMRGMRVQSIVQELRGEKIDIVEFSEDPETYIKNALSPAKVARIVLNPEEKQMTIIVAEDQMSLAIGKKGQNVRLAAKLVRWKVDIKGPSEALELGGQHAFLTPGKTSVVDFLDDIKNAKGLGEKVMTILFNENVVTYEETLNRGIKGLVLLPGIGPKKAEALMQLTEAHIKESELAQESVEEETPEPDEAVTETIESEPDTDEPVVEKEDLVDEEDEEIPVQELKGLTPEVLQTLINNGFETLAELSVTPLDDLLSMEGIDEKIGQSILEQVKQRLENLENV